MKGDLKQIVILVVSFAVGLVAFSLTHLYLSAERAKLREKQEQMDARLQKVKVLVAARPLSAGTIIRDEDVAKKSVPRGGLTGEPVLPEDIDRIRGMKLLLALETEEPIPWSYVDTPYRAGGGLSAMVNKRMRAISIAVGGASAVSGLVQPNDHVDVIGTFSLPAKTAQGESETVTMTVLQNVTVLATGTQLSKGGSAARRGEAGGYSMVTLEVSPEEAELLVFAGFMKGRLSLSLRNPTDLHYLRDLENVDFSHLREKIPQYNEKRNSRPPLSSPR